MVNGPYAFLLDELKKQQSLVVACRSSGASRTSDPGHVLLFGGSDPLAWTGRSGRLLVILTPQQEKFVEWMFVRFSGIFSGWRPQKQREIQHLPYFEEVTRCWLRLLQGNTSWTFRNGWDPVSSNHGSGTWSCLEDFENSTHLPGIHFHFSFPEFLRLPIYQHLHVVSWAIWRKLVYTEGLENGLDTTFFGTPWVGSFMEKTSALVSQFSTIWPDIASSLPTTRSWGFQDLDMAE